MEILKKPFGDYQTNCYILKMECGELIIDAGMGAHRWIKQECKNPLALLCTHGHFDHIWDNAKVKSLFPHIPLICHANDAFMLEGDCFGLGLTPSSPDLKLEGIENELKFQDFNVRFLLFAGHTPGCCMIEVNHHLFSGDFIFYHCIGRSDFEYSNPADMRESLQRFKTFSPNLPIHPGHGEDTEVTEEQRHIDFWIERTR
ncbi:MBL fold metallo-hydrolase [Helicobacter pametensis]|uniref:MBL fold metallo-hydrolase n=1 Tax=Helicobacter pametensis TaxID=95149 RepID=UPI000489912B|nr:MBL fold metallo-hydrolase [Helicobacter pametensis]